MKKYKAVRLVRRFGFATECIKEREIRDSAES